MDGEQRRSNHFDFSRDWEDDRETPMLRDVAFNRHSINDGNHNSPLDRGRLDVGLDRISVRLKQGIHEEDFKRVLGLALLATTGIDPDSPPEELPWEEMMRGGLQSSLESQVVVFEIAGVDRTNTHQLVRTRKAAFHQQSQRATFMGNEPDTRIPESIWRNQRARSAFLEAVVASREAYRIAAEEDISYQDARAVLLESTETYIVCEYPLREFINTYAYRACSMFNWQIVYAFREMGRLLIEAHPWLSPYIKISCQTSETCPGCHGTGRVDVSVYSADDEGDSDGMIQCPPCGGGGKLGTGRCTFQGWESVEEQCDFPWAKEELRTFQPDRSLKIGG
jgi:thymidylate synthase ThyX